MCENHREDLRIKEHGCKLSPQNIHMLTEGQPSSAVQFRPRDLFMRPTVTPPMKCNKELDSSFQDSYFAHSRGSCKLPRRFLRGPLGEKVPMNVLPVSWKLFPSRHRCLHSCHLACLEDWWKKKKKKKQIKKEHLLRIVLGP